MGASSRDPGREFLLAARDLCVYFPGTKAVDRVSLTVRPGDVLAIVGANGSGKTTLLSALCGLRRPTAGQVLDANGEVVFRSPRDALRKGITLVPQEPQLAATLSCWENVVLGHSAPYGIRTFARSSRAAARKALQTALPGIPPATRAGDLRKADRAVVALLAALARHPKLLALDEPTAVLGEQAVEVVSTAVEQVRGNGGAVILVSHRLRDIVALATRVVVLVDGELTYESDATDELSVDALVERLTHGRERSEDYERTTPQAMRLAEDMSQPLLRAAGIRSSNGLEIDELEVRPQEIVGLAGLAGSGRSRLLRTLIGASRITEGTIELGGRPFRGDIRAARRAGAAFVPEDRAAEGVFAPLSVARNLTMGELVAGRSLARLSSRRAERQLALSLIVRFGIKTPHTYAPVTSLSGGNQQRVVLARGLSAQPKILLADEPTQGVDITGRADIQQMLRQFAAAGGGVLFASSDFEELLSLSTRIVVLRDGVLLGELTPSETDYRTLVALTSGAQIHIDPRAVEDIA